ncbi:hypothetical protein EC957_000621 [Mortierella hygrophila]|uniref:Xrn1 N-terminal domain-containing protein n=1 Tax=Mortierella hygrophila TaxID=979708 RepID=A0A9P6F7D3_9FUNG|nr:hypothetical protein EC957_000621 [Mortierella hygrophila]
MGLKEVKFIDWFQGKFPHAARVVARHEGAHFDSVFIDVNCILHPAMRAAKNEAQFVKKLYTILDKTFSQFIPDRICYLSVDGPAPLAKLLTQKARRASKSGSGKPNHMSTLQVTPGCPFMLRLEQYLSYYTVRYLQHRRSQGISPDLKFVIDHSNNPGEGESKIIENVVQQAANIRGRPCAILSMDSDAIIQAITLGMPNIFVVRKDSPQNPIVAISIDKFMRSLEGIFPGESNRSRLDFCALCLFRGNDYLRGLFVGLEKLWLAYLYTRLVDPAIQTRGPARYLIDATLKTFDLFFLKQLILNSYKDNKTLKIPDNLAPQQAQPQQQQSPIVGSESEVSEQDEYGNTSDMESASEDDSSTDDDEDAGGDINATGSNSDIDDSSDQEKKYSVKDYLEGVLWNLEMYCSGVCPDVSFTYKFKTAPPRRAIVTYVDTIVQKKPYQTLSASSTRKLVGVVTSNKTYLHPLVCAMILLPIDRAAAYLPESMALVQSAIVPEESRYLTHEEMMTIEETVHGIIDVLSRSNKPQDIKVAKELYGLYNTRSPYIWTRVRTVNTRTPKTETPPSPNVIIDALQALTISSPTPESSKPAPASQQQQERFVDLEYQQDIICTLTKTLPSAAQVGQPNRVPEIVVSWAADPRQLDITAQGARPSTPWMFFSLRQSRFGRPGPGQQQYRPRAPQQHQQQHRQPYNQARPNVPDTWNPQNIRHTPQPNTFVDNPGQQQARRWTRPPAPHAQPQAPPATTPTNNPGNKNNNNQRTLGRKPKPAPSSAPGPGPHQQRQQGKRTEDGNAVLPAEKVILVSSAN